MIRIHNPDFNVTEFSNIKNESGSNGFVLTVKQWVSKIDEGLKQKERLKKLNTIAIQQMKLLIVDHGIKKLGEKK